MDKLEELFGFEVTFGFIVVRRGFRRMNSDLAKRSITVLSHEKPGFHIIARILIARLNTFAYTL